jgi:hypothetical protein
MAETVSRDFWKDPTRFVGFLSQGGRENPHHRENRTRNAPDYSDPQYEHIHLRPLAAKNVTRRQKSRDRCPLYIFDSGQKGNLERETGVEPATSSLGSWRSTTELLPLTSE